MTEISENDVVARIRATMKALGLKHYKDESGFLHLQLGKKFAIPFLKEVGGFVKLDTPGETEGMVDSGLSMALEGNSPTPPPLPN